MKELSIEEKAKAYDEALERVGELLSRCIDYRDRITKVYRVEDIESIFPELKESEESKDERIRRVIRGWIYTRPASFFDNGISKEEMLAWLEKQGEKKFIISDDALREGIAHFGITQYQIDNWLKKYVDVEKQGSQILANSAKTCKDEQKTTDKCEGCNNAKGCVSCVDGSEWAHIGEKKHADNVEPKFKVGDWVVSNLDGNARQISEVHFDEYNSYYVVDGEDVNLEEYDRLHHLWTIQDAKDGDVLVCGDFGYTSLMLFESFSNGRISLHCWYNSQTNNFHLNTDVALRKDANIHPATKEQRDTLFAKMHEAGYEWNSEKKELKKIEDDEYNGEDYGIDSLWHAKNILEKTLGKVDGYKSDDGILEHKCAISAIKKLYKQKSAWSEEDEYIIEEIEALIDVYVLEENNPKALIDWLKSIKDRVQPQNHWKPSEEQMSALDSMLQYGRVSHNSFSHLHLNSLFNDLKKLREE